MTKVGATPYISMSVHHTTILCWLSDGFCLIGREHPLYHWKMLSLCRPYHVERVLYHLICVRKRIDRLGYCGILTRTGVVYPMQVDGLLPFMDTGTWTEVQIQV